MHSPWRMNRYEPMYPGSAPLTSAKKLKLPSPRRGTHPLEVHIPFEPSVHAAPRTLRIATQSQLAEAHAQRVVGQQPPHQGLADVEQQLQGFRGLHEANEAGQHAEHPGLAAI